MSLLGAETAQFGGSRAADRSRGVSGLSSHDSQSEQYKLPIELLFPETFLSLATF